MIYLYELRSLKKPFIIFMVIESIILSALLALYKLYIKNIDSVMEFYNSLHKNVLLGFGIDKSNCSSILAYYTYILNIIFYITALMASYFAFKSTNTFNDDKYFYFSKPIKAKTIINHKIYCGLTLAFISFLIINLLSTILILLVNNESFNIWTLTEINFELFLLFTIVYILSFAIGIFFKGLTPLLRSLIITTVFETINMLQKIYNINFFKWINPFSYFTVSDIVNEGKYQYRFILITIFVSFFIFYFVQGLFSTFNKPKRED